MTRQEKINQLEDEFGIRVGAMDVVFENLDTVNHMLVFIARKKAAVSG